MPIIKDRNILKWDEVIKETGLSDEECARLLDVSRPTVRRWRDGSTAPLPAMRQALTKHL